MKDLVFTPVIVALPALMVVMSARPIPAPADAFVVAHRGASAYAPEHTIAAYTLALEQGADYVEQDLTLTSDGVLVCLHDDTLERTTDVEARFPDRAVVEHGPGGQPVKRWYANDFTLAELKTLDAGSWFDARFAGARIPTFEEAIVLVKGRAGIFPELKSPARLNARGADVEQAVAGVLATHGLRDAQVKGRPAVYLQSFEEKTVRRLATLLPAVPRTFLLGRGRRGAVADRGRPARGEDVRDCDRPGAAADRGAPGDRRRRACGGPCGRALHLPPGARFWRRRARGGARRHAPLPRRLPRRRRVHRQPGSVPALNTSRPAASSAGIESRCDSPGT